MWTISSQVLDYASSMRCSNKGSTTSAKHVYLQVEMGDNLIFKNITMKYIVYLTTNTLNNKIYVGVHKTDNPLIFDGYLGCGVTIQNPKSYQNNKTPFQFAVTKYGIKNFKRNTIQEFDTLQDALDLEECIVDEKFIAREDTYNATIGGGYPPILNKVIYQYTLSGKFIKEWNSIVEASNSLECSESCIGRAVIYNTTSNNFLWTDYKVEQLHLADFSIYNPEKVVYEYNEFGEYVTLYKSISSAASNHNVATSNIQRSLKGGYKTDNCYFSFELQTNYNKSVNTRLRNTPVHQYDLYGNFIQSFSCIKEVEKEFECRMDGINTAIRLGGQHKGFQWSRERIEAMKPLEKPRSTARKVGQFSMNGELINIYNTVRECRQDFANVSKVLRGLANHCKGYTFKYID